MNFLGFSVTTAMLTTGIVTALVATVGVNPAEAASFTVSGDPGVDYYIYEQQGNQTLRNEGADLDDILLGNSSAPGGNIELAANSEQSGFDFTKATTLTGDVAGQTLTLSSLTEADWFTTSSGGFSMNYGSDNFATNWFNQLWTKAVGLDASLGIYGNSLAYSAFYSSGGFQRASDPNISYINANGINIDIGLAGHYDISNVYSFLPAGLQASEVVKYEYGGDSSYLYSFSATPSGLIAVDDGKSHSGNYEVSIPGVINPKPVPEPLTILGSAVALGFGALFKKRQAQKA